MATYKMKFKKMYTESGWVGEVIGNQSPTKFMLNYLIPQEGKLNACKKGYGTYVLEEGKRYMLQITGEESFKYAKVENGQLIFIPRAEVKQHIQNMENRSRTKYTPSINKSNVSIEVTFAQSQLEAAFKALREQRDQKLFKEMVSFVTKYAEQHGITKNCLEIYKSLSQNAYFVG